MGVSGKSNPAEPVVLGSDSLQRHRQRGGRGGGKETGNYMAAEEIRSKWTEGIGDAMRAMFQGFDGGGMGWDGLGMGAVRSISPREHVGESPRADVLLAVLLRLGLSSHGWLPRARSPSKSE